MLVYMGSYLHPSQLERLETLKASGKFVEALSIVNQVLTKDPHNEEALLQVADIKYRKGEIEGAEKAIDFLNIKKKNADPMGLYVKGVLEMEKNNWKEAKKYLQKAITLTNYDNHEIMRCYGLCEYWYGNREKGINFLESAFDLHEYDAEIIYNLIELYLLDRRYRDASSMISYYYKYHEELETFDKDISYYDYKITLFEKFVASYRKRKKRKAF